MRSQKKGPFGRRRFLEVAGGSIALASLPVQMASTREVRTKRELACSVCPAVPDRLFRTSGKGCLVRDEVDVVSLSNPYLAVEISKTTGLVKGLADRLLNCSYRLMGDETGFRVRRPGERLCEWWATSPRAENLETEVVQTPEYATVVLISHLDGVDVKLEYSIRNDHFWVERLLSVTGEDALGRFESLVYGRLDVPEGESRVLKLGRFDQPLLVEVGTDGGLFAGVAWWFYQVDKSGTYLNQDMDYQCGQEFKSEPWYLGVFASEEDEPYPGWLWYKTFLQQRKMADDRQTSWSYWNAGWGQWGIDIDDPAVPAYLELMDDLGVRGVAFGGGLSGKGMKSYVSLMGSDQVSRSNLGLLEDYQIAGGFLEHGGLGEDWADGDLVSAKLRLLKEYAALGARALHLDFFETIDNYTAHRNVGTYLETARELLDYTECHLGMAIYGPQFQGQVLLNHPTDLHGFDISHFSSDWATFLGFRQSRREWQKRYDYLMPEYSLYYFVTHYSNWGHPRHYLDPEPQQLLYAPHAYCGIAYNFHDLIGFRNTLAAASAFTPYYVFGHLELKMPKRDVEFAASYLRWVSENADLLGCARICFETKDACVVSKIRDGKGAVFLLNYGPQDRSFRLRFLTGVSGTTAVREVYPLRKSEFKVRGTGEFEVELGGEQVVILEINRGLQSLPPENPGNFRKEMDGWIGNSFKWSQSISLPDLRRAVNRMSDLDLPELLESLDQIGEVAAGISTDGQTQNPNSAAALGRGHLPEAFLRLYGFREDRFVEAWKLVPWAFPNRIWLVLTLKTPVPIEGPLPTLELNKQRVSLFPRIDYRPEKSEAWKCPILLADITAACKHGAKNSVTLSNLDERPVCYVISSAYPDT